MKAIFSLLTMVLVGIANVHADESKIQDVKSAGTNLAPMPMSTVMNLRGRYDWTHTENKTASGKSKESEFSAQDLRLVTDGKVNATTKFSFTLKPLKSATNEEMVDTAFVTKKLNDTFSVLIGKQAPLVGGRENDYADYDLYLLSSFKSALLGNTPGVSIQTEMAGQSLYLQALKSSTTTLKSTYTYGASYYGNFLDGKIVPILSYHQEATDRSKQKNKYIALGSQFTSGNTVLEFDWLKKTEEKNGASSKNLDTTSMVLQLKYNHEMFEPFAKIIMDKKENINATVTETERTGWEAGLEFHPSKDEDLQYHLVYNSAETKEKVGGTATTTDTQVIVGATFSFNILQ